jgi:hypothetical protein
VEYIGGRAQRDEAVMVMVVVAKWGRMREVMKEREGTPDKQEQYAEEGSTQRRAHWGERRWYTWTAHRG